MTNEMFPYVALGFISVLFSSASQVMLKKSSEKKYDHILQEYLNLRTIVAYGIFFLSTLLTMAALKKVPLSMSPMFESSSYIFVSVFGALFLREKITVRKMVGLLLILIGIRAFTM